MKQKIAEMLNGEIENILSAKDIIIWGADATGKACYTLLTEKKLNNKVIAFIDSDKKKQGKSFEGGYQYTPPSPSNGSTQRVHQ